MRCLPRGLFVLLLLSVPLGEHVAVGAEKVGAEKEAGAKADGGAASAPILGRGPNIVLITADTLRADHLGTYGYFRDTSPVLDALAKESVVWERAVVTMSTTLPSHTSIMTSAYPSHHGVLSNLRFFHQPVVTDGELQTLAQRLSAAGYSTAGFTSSSPLSSASGINAGFQVFEGPPPYATEERRIDVAGEETTSKVLTWLLTARPPFFLWVHYFDPHYPYRPPHPFDRRFQPEPPLESYLGSLAVPGPRLAKATLDTNGYDGEILYMDTQIGRLIEHLRRFNHYDASLVVFTADHGEGLWQHDWLEHGLLWNEQTYAPLIMKLPQGSEVAPGRRRDLASTIDIVPTVLGAAGQEVPENLGGVDLLRGTREFALSERTSRPNAAWDGELYTLTSVSWKYHHHSDGPDELYDLRSDPHELRNVIDEHPGVARRMLDETQRLLAENRARSPLRVKSSIPDVIYEQLKKLGYGD